MTKFNDKSSQKKPNVDPAKRFNEVDEEDEEIQRKQRPENQQSGNTRGAPETKYAGDRDRQGRVDRE